MKPLFGAINQTVGKMIARNAPRYTKIVEPFGDKGTFALFVEKKPASNHIVNVVDEALFNAFLFAQSYSNSDFSNLKKLDWVGSQETFDQVMSIPDIEGAQAFYKFVYLKKFGMKMPGADAPTFDVMSTGKDIKNSLFSLPMMKSLLKKVSFLNDDPLSLIPSDGFMILTPPTDQVDAVKAKLKGLSGEFFFAAKAKDSDAVVSDAESLPDLNVIGAKVASIMMASYSVITNFDSKLVPIDPAAMKDGGMSM